MSSSQWDLIRQVFGSWETSCMIEKGSSLDLEKIVLRSLWLVAITARARLLVQGLFPLHSLSNQILGGLQGCSVSSSLAQVFYHIPDLRTSAWCIPAGKYYVGVLAM